MGIRSFIAVNLDGDLKKKIAEETENLRKIGGDIKWVPPENLHITLKFLGDTDEDLIPTVQERLSVISSSSAPFSLRLSGAGVFPDKRRPRVIWIDINNPGELIKLQGSVEVSMVSIGFVKEDRPFSAHLTLGRVKALKNLKSLIDPLEALRDRDFGNIEVNSFSLMKSVLEPKGPEYTVIKEFHFG